MKTWVVLAKPKHIKLYIAALVLFSLAIFCLLPFLEIQSKTILFLIFLIIISGIILCSYQFSLMTQETSLIFIEDMHHRLYVIDLHQHFKTAAKIEKAARRIQEQQQLPKSAVQIVSIDKIRCHLGRDTLFCRDPHDQPLTLVMPARFADKESLRLCLERIQANTSILETKSNKKPFAMIGVISLLLLSILIGIQSHPAVAKFPQVLYFPALLTAFMLLTVIIYLIRRK